MVLTAGTAVITTGSYTFTIVVKSLSRDMDKQLMIFPFPTKGADDTRTILIDLQRCKEAVTINGYVVDTSGGLADSATTSGTPLYQIAQLTQMMRATKDLMTLKWGAQGTYETIQGSISKVDIKEEVGTLEGYNNAVTNKAWHKLYSIQLVFVRGSEVR